MYFLNDFFVFWFKSFIKFVQKGLIKNKLAII